MKITIKSVSKHYVSRGRETHALLPVDLTIQKGEFIAFVGPSGCGKSTLLNMIAGIIQSSSGHIYQDGKEVKGINTHIGYMTQMDSILPWLTVEENIALPLRLRSTPENARQIQVKEMMQAVDLTAFATSFPSELSGGMRKRVALAQVLVYNPTVLLMDEPFGALDAQLKLLMQQRLLDIWRQNGQSIIFVTHDLAEAITLAQKVVVFSGRPGHIKTIKFIDISFPRDPFKVRFLPEFQRAYEDLWAILSPEIAKGEDN